VVNRPSEPNGGIFAMLRVMASLAAVVQLTDGYCTSVMADVVLLYFVSFNTDADALRLLW
jgi:hypothetical protein